MLYRLKKFILLWALLFPAMVTAHYQDLAILVVSCDKYAELWPPFFHYLYKSWPSLLTTNKEVPIILTSNHQSYIDDKNRITNIKVGHDLSWSDNLLQVLPTIKQKYVLLLLEDYFLAQPVNEARLIELLELVKNKHAGYLQLRVENNQDNSKLTLVDNSSQVAYKWKYADFRTSLQAAIWDKEVLAWLLKPGENPWDFESPGSIRSQGHPQAFLTLVGNEPLVYWNAMFQSHWNSEVLKILAQDGVKVERKLPVDSEHKLKLWYRKVFIPFLYWQIWLPGKTWVKKLLP